MSEFSWDTEEKEAVHPPHQDEGAEEPRTLAMSVQDFSALEERILRAVTLVKRERQQRAEAEALATRAEAQLRDQAREFEDLQKEVGALRVERNEVRQRVDRLLAQLDALEL